ncbi:RhuM family protein [Necropsobacter rosorum]|uniref:RhuM family protein n=1 Tax=Pasteurellaceae TaxID=712 RepID=UPI00402570DA
MSNSSIRRAKQISRELERYNLDAIISVGYRINLSKTTQFRRWATQMAKKVYSKRICVR